MKDLEYSELLHKYNILRSKANRMLKEYNEVVNKYNKLVDEYEELHDKYVNRVILASKLNIKGRISKDIFLKELEHSEEYKEIPAYPGYFITTYGKVYNENSQEYVKKQFSGKYIHIKLKKRDSKRYDYIKLHILMLEVFVSLRPTGLWACHKNDVKEDNRLSNLYWGTPSDNARDAVRNERRPKFRTRKKMKNDRGI